MLVRFREKNVAPRLGRKALKKNGKSANHHPMIKRARAKKKITAGLCLKNICPIRSAKKRKKRERERERKKMNDARRSVAPPEVDWEHLDKKKFLMLGAAVFSVR